MVGQRKVDIRGPRRTREDMGCRLLKIVIFFFFFFFEEIEFAKSRRSRLKEEITSDFCREGTITA